jgi:hypothetical protein|tara:strand:- start:100 stop:471 length:372 start_codon:yes stop_codon:yes gene_type:complete
MSQGITNLSRRREVLSLYRSMLRSARAFYWTDEKGESWKQVLSGSARKEFEMNRHEQDPLEIARLIVSGHGYLTEVENRFTAMEQKMKDHIASTRGRGGKHDGVRTRGKNEDVWYDKHDGRTR